MLYCPGTAPYIVPTLLFAGNSVDLDNTVSCFHRAYQHRLISKALALLPTLKMRSIEVRQEQKGQLLPTWQGHDYCPVNETLRGPDL